MFLTDCGHGKSELLLGPVHKLEGKSIKDRLKLISFQCFFFFNGEFHLP